MLSEPAGEGWQMGKTKVFLKDRHELLLEKARTYRIITMSRRIQKAVRGALARKRFQDKTKAIELFQRRWRAYEFLFFLFMRTSISTCLVCLLLSVCEFVFNLSALSLPNVLRKRHLSTS